MSECVNEWMGGWVDGWMRDANCFFVENPASIV